MKIDIKGVSHNFPDVFIVGFPRSGSTLLNYYLSQNDNIFTINRELNYLNIDESNINPINFLDYLKKYKDVKNKLIIEKSIMIYSKIAPVIIKHYNPNAKIIVLKRNLQDYKKKTYSFDNNNSLFYSFDEHIDYWKMFFTNTLVIKSEILFEEPQESLNKICDFIGVKKFKVHKKYVAGVPKVKKNLMFFIYQFLVNSGLGHQFGKAIKNKDKLDNILKKTFRENS